MIVIGAALAVVAAMPAGVTAQGRVIITLASLAPEGSVWDNELKQLAADWGKLSNNSVQLRVFSGGRLGTESSVISQMRAGARPEAAVLTTGLSELDDGFSVFSLPFFFDSLDEVSAVIEALEPVLTAKLEPQGLTLVSWGFGGWVHMFSATPITTLDDLKKAKLFTSAGDNVAENWYRRNGFNPVALGATDVGAALASGSITAMPAPPYAALVFQWYRETPHMLDVQVAPLIGGVVVNTRAWNRIPADIRPKLIDAARDTERRLMAKIPAQDRDAVKEMQARSLKVSQPDAGFRASAEPLIESMRGAWIPDDVYDLALKARAAYRQAKNK
jgi:TRAP-type C4-dicarboxylate transport system substrate-binding protein